MWVPGNSLYLLAGKYTEKILYSQYSGKPSYQIPGYVRHHAPKIEKAHVGEQSGPGFSSGNSDLVIEVDVVQCMKSVPGVLPYLPLIHYQYLLHDYFHAGGVLRVDLY